MNLELELQIGITPGAQEEDREAGDEQGKAEPQVWQG